MKKLLLTLFFFAFLALGSGTVFACVCGSDSRPLSDEEIRAVIDKEFDQFITVFAGEVVELDRYKVRFKISQLWKGDLTDEIVMSTGTVKIDDAISRLSSCDYSFKLNEKYLVYASKSEAGLVAYKCTGTKPLIKAERDITELDKLNPNVYQPLAPDAILLWRNLTTHSTGARVSLPLMLDLAISAVNARPVNSGVRRLA